MRSRGNRIVAAAALAVLLAGCSGSPAAPPVAPSPTTAATPAGTPPGSTRPPVWSAAVTGETAVNPGFRQGLARTGDDWVFSTNNGLYRTDATGQVAVTKSEAPIPPSLAAEGYDHIGDIDIAGEVLWAPIERDDKSSGRQQMARYDPTTLAFVGATEVPQHHASFVAVDGDTVYSTDEFDDDTIVRYRWTGAALDPLPPLPMDRLVARIQGGDVADGAIWLSTDDDRNGWYRVDLATGHVDDLGSMGHVAGEGEGIDATSLPSGLLHALVSDEKLVPMWLVDGSVTAAPA